MYLVHHYTCIIILIQWCALYILHVVWRRALYTNPNKSSSLKTQWNSREMYLNCMEHFLINRPRGSRQNVQRFIYILHIPHSTQFLLTTCIHMCVLFVRMCACDCVHTSWTRRRCIDLYQHLCMYIHLCTLHIYTYIYRHMYVCVCVCMSASSYIVDPPHVCK